VKVIACLTQPNTEVLLALASGDPMGFGCQGCGHWQLSFWRQRRALFDGIGQDRNASSAGLIH